MYEIIGDPDDDTCDTTASCVRQAVLHQCDNLDWKVTWPGVGGQKFREGALLTLSRTNPEVDAHKASARILRCDCKSKVLFIGRAWNHPADALVGEWRLDLEEDMTSFYRMLSAVDQLCSRPGSDALQQTRGSRR